MSSCSQRNLDWHDQPGLSVAGLGITVTHNILLLNTNYFIQHQKSQGHSVTELAKTEIAQICMHIKAPQK